MTEQLAWSRRVADELWSGVVTPLTFSVLAEQMAEHMVARRLRRAGLTQVSRAPVFCLIRGHVYVNATLLHDVMREVPTVLLSEGVLALLPEPLRADLADRSRAFYDPRTVATVARLTWNERGWAPWSRAELFRAEAARVAEEFEGFRVPADLGPEEVLERLDAVRVRLGAFLEVVSWAMIYAYLFFHLGERLVRAWVPDGESLSIVATGVPGVRTFEVHAELSALAARVRAEPALRRAIVEPPTSEVVAALERGDLGEFGSAVLDIGRRHGHRLIARDLAFPTWGEKPELLVDMVRRLAAADSMSARPDRAAAFERLRAELARGPSGLVRGPLFDWALSWCREYYAVRENMRYHADYFLAALRKLSLAGGRRLVERGSLRSVDDVFYLTSEELRDELRGPDPNPELAARVSTRRDRYESYRQSAPPEVVWGEPAEIDSFGAPSCAPPDGRERPRSLSGTPASPGLAEGRACVIRSADELDAVRLGDVIVATSTDPTWTTYLSLASGLVLEVGGLLSHGAIVARELGIPAVVDLAGATSILCSGERVHVDGVTGRVERLDEA